MFKSTKAFSGFSVNDLEKAKQFYGQILGLDVSDAPGLPGFKDPAGKILSVLEG